MRKNSENKHGLMPTNSTCIAMMARCTDRATHWSQLSQAQPSLVSPKKPWLTPAPSPHPQPPAITPTIAPTHSIDSSPVAHTAAAQRPTRPPTRQQTKAARPSLSTVQKQAQRHKWRVLLLLATAKCAHAKIRGRLRVDAKRKIAATGVKLSG
jgi:hypothetical protein